MIHDKAEYMTRERKDIEKAKHWLMSYPRYEALQLYGLKDVTDKATQIRGIDLIGDTLMGLVTIEVKTRYGNYSDILLETYSKEETESHGWVNYSEADYLAYLIDQGGRIRGSILDMQALRAWWATQDPESYKQIKSINKGYVTLNRAVKYTDIPQEIYLYTDYLNIK